MNYNFLLKSHLHFGKRSKRTERGKNEKNLVVVFNEGQKFIMVKVEIIKNLKNGKFNWLKAFIDSFEIFKQVKKLRSNKKISPRKMSWFLIKVLK